MKKECSTCRFFAHHKCRLVPPVVLPSGHTQWPAVQPDDFCGEWRELYLPGAAGRPFVIKEAVLISHLRRIIGSDPNGKTLSELSRHLAATGPAELSPSALYARLKKLVAAEILVKDGLRYHMADDEVKPTAAPTVEVD